MVKAPPSANVTISDKGYDPDEFQNALPQRASTPASRPCKVRTTNHAYG